MPIVSSSYVIDAHTQVGGERYVKETLTDSQGRVINRIYKLPSGQGDAEAAARLAAHESALNTQLAEAEIDQIIDGG